MTIENIEHINERYCLISGYRDGLFHAVAYDGKRPLKSIDADELNAVNSYEQLRKWLLNVVDDAKIVIARKEK
ncbi:MAG: hypothetical protein ACK4NR_12075 [Micavibrio sp.]